MYLIRAPGFSRGAYQVRALAGMIARVSLFPNKNHCLFHRQLRLQRSGYFSQETTNRYHCKVARSSGSYTSNAFVVLSIYIRKRTMMIRA